MLHSVALKLLFFAGLGGLLLRPAPGRAESQPRTDSLLRVLDCTLAQQATFDGQRLARLADLTAHFRAPRAPAAVRFGLALRLCDEYQVFQYDSCFAYSRQLGRLSRQLGSPALVQTARTVLARTLRSAGLFKDALDTLQAIRAHLLPPPYQMQYYETYSSVYSELAEYDRDAYYQPLYMARSYAYADSAGHTNPPGSYVRLAQLLQRARQQHRLAAGQALYAQLRRLPLTPHQIAINASLLAKLYEQAGRPDQAMQLMVLAAINDIRSATKEGIALFHVSEYCYQRGDLLRADRYINQAKQTAAFFKARQRLVQLSPIASLIDGQKIALAEGQRRQARAYAWAVGLLAAVVLGFAGIIYMQLRRLQRAGKLLAATNQELHINNDKLQSLNALQQQLNDKLSELNLGLNEANRVKEEYIGYYFSNTTHYIDKLESLRRKLGTMLATKQLGAAQRLVEELDIKAERAALFKGFDTVFVHLFPNFVADFNALFPENERTHLADDQILNTELRIFALIRLGISNSEQISRVLGYSIHTVYAYKTRVKNRSFLPNEAFEARVLAIQAA